LGNYPLPVQGAFSPLLTRSDRRDLDRIQGFSTTTGGIAGGVLGASLGALVAEKLEVGPITATGLTIAGGIAGTTFGTAVGQTIGTSITAYIAAKGGFASLLSGVLPAGITGAGAGGFGALLSAPLAGSGLLGLGIGGGVGALGLLGGLGIGAAVNYLDADDAMSREQRSAERQAAYETAIGKQQRDLETARREGLLRYRDMRPGATLGQLFSEREARTMPGFELGFTGFQRRFSQETLLGTDEALIPRNQADLQKRQLDIEAQITTQYKTRKSIEEELQRVKRRPVAEEDKELTNQVIAQLERQLELYDQLADVKGQKQLMFDYGTLDPERIKTLDDYRTRMANKWAERQRKDQEDVAKAEEKRRENLTEMSNVLAKLRDAEAGSFRVVGDIGASLAGPDNPYTEVLANQITAAERMRQQWGHLGDDAVQYFTTLEQLNNNRALTRLEFQSYQAGSNLLLQAARERDARQDPSTISRKDQEYLNIQSAIVDRAIQIPQLWQQAANVLGLTLTPFQQITGQLMLINQAFGVRGPRIENRYGQDVTPDGIKRNAYGQSLGGYFDIEPRRNVYGQSLEDPAISRMFSSIGAGESPQVRDALRKSFADSILGAFRNFSPAQIRDSGYQDVFRGATQLQRSNLDDTISQEIRKADFAAREDVRLQQQLRADEAFRQQQIALGRDARTVGAESDKLLLARTEGIPLKDLTFDQFKNRQDALEREAARTVGQQEEARVATQKGLEYQRELIAVVTGLRAAVLGGDLNAVIQIQNDTRARLDAKSLETSSGQYVVPDQRNVKSSTFTPATMKYDRPGGAYGLSNK
jgi:hypothetical protein